MCHHVSWYLSWYIYIYPILEKQWKTLHSFWHVCWPMSTYDINAVLFQHLHEFVRKWRYQKLPLPFFIPIGKWWSTTGFGGTLPVSMFWIFLVHHESCKCHANHAKRQVLLRIPNVRILKCNWRASLEIHARETSEKDWKGRWCCCTSSPWNAVSSTASSQSSSTFDAPPTPPVGLTNASSPCKAVCVLPHADIRRHFEVALAASSADLFQNARCSSDTKSSVIVSSFCSKPLSMENATKHGKDLVLRCLEFGCSIL